MSLTISRIRKITWALNNGSWDRLELEKAGKKAIGTSIPRLNLQRSGQTLHHYVHFTICPLPSFNLHLSACRGRIIRTIYGK